MTKILLDTDIGTDVDDAVCLAYLLSQPDCELLGITTVMGEADKRASLASVLCRMAGRDIPIYPGAEEPMRVPSMQTAAPQAAALPRWPHQTAFPRGQAVDFLRRTIRQYPGEVVLVAIAPLTNVGALFASDSEVAGLLKGLVLMGGVFNPASPDYHRVESNVAGDPHAAEIVYRAPVPVHRSIGLDVTQQVVMSAEEVRARFTAPLLQPVLDFAEIWFAQVIPAIVFHDPLTAATVFDASLCSFEQGTVTVDMVSQPGRTFWQPSGQDKPHEVAVSVSPRRYFDHFFSLL
jgi:purine nucleosidase